MFTRAEVACAFKTDDVRLGALSRGRTKATNAVVCAGSDSGDSSQCVFSVPVIAGDFVSDEQLRLYREILDVVPDLWLGKVRSQGPIDLPTERVTSRINMK